MKLRQARTVSSATVAAAGLIGGYVTARETGIRPLGGVVLGAALGYASRTWYETSGTAVTVGLAATYLAGFGLSHPLAKVLGAWPAVLTVSATTAGLSYALVDRKN